MKIQLNSAQGTEQFGAKLFKKLPEKCVVFLLGNLGVGKTTLVRGFLRQAGHTGAVKSPTYTLVEEYEINGRKFCHFDLYRLSDPEELEWMGIRDYFMRQAVSFIEWPEMGQGYLPEADLIIKLDFSDGGRLLELKNVTNLEINFNLNVEKQ